MNENPSILKNNKNLPKTLPEILSETLATVVLYNTSLESSPTFQTLGNALRAMGLSMDILVYDNSSFPQKVQSTDTWQVHYIHDSSNGGVSKAYNAAFEIAKRNGKKWLLLLDQDTSYPPSFFSEYYDSMSQYPDQQVFVSRLSDASGMVSPLQFRSGGGKRVQYMKPGVYSIHDFKFHNCGVWISASTFEKAGGYDENLPLDFSDFSFTDRLRKGTSNFVVTSVAGTHPLAATSIASLDERLTRFKSYMKAGRYYKSNYRPEDWKISVRIFLRSLKLSWTYGTLRFIKLYLRNGYD